MPLPHVVIFPSAKSIWNATILMCHLQSGCKMLTPSKGVCSFKVLSNSSHHRLRTQPKEYSYFFRNFYSLEILCMRLFLWRILMTPRRNFLLISSDVTEIFDLGKRHCTTCARWRIVLGLAPFALLLAPYWWPLNVIRYKDICRKRIDTRDVKSHLFG